MAMAMAMAMALFFPISSSSSSSPLVLLFTLSLLLSSSSSFSTSLSVSEQKALFELKEMLEYPIALSSWTEQTDFCNLPSSPTLTLSCDYEEDNTIFLTHLEIIGDRGSSFNEAGNGSSRLSQDFSSESLFLHLTNFTKMKTLHLSSLGLWGPISSKLGRLTYLETLNLTSNFFQGVLPNRLTSLQSLRVLCLDGNMLNGTLPQKLSSLGNLSVLTLANNKMYGAIPNSVSVLTHLQELDLSSNLFSSLPPPSLFSLPNLTSLNMARNHFTGVLPNNLTFSTTLTFLDLSFNLFTGALPSAIRSLSILDTAQQPLVQVNFQWNCFSTDLQPQNPFSHCADAALASGLGPDLGAYPSPLHAKHAKSRMILMGLIGGAIALILIFVFILIGLFVMWRRCQRKHQLHTEMILKPIAGGGGSSRPCMGQKSVAISSEILSSARYISRNMKLGGMGFPQFRVFSMDELYKATDYFHDSTLIGEGSHGKVYKGQLDDGTLVAIKRLKKEPESRANMLKTRVEHVGKFRHKHLVTLLGYNMVEEGDGPSQGIQMCLVYEYVSSRTLRTGLSGKGLEGFGWLHRLVIIIGTAKGIHFLHFGLVPGIFDNNISTTNVLLDQNLVPKLSDFGFSIQYGKGQIEGKSQASKGLSQVEKKNRKESADKSDVYNFGLILLEVLMGKMPTMGTHGPKELESLLGEQGSRLECIDPRILGTCMMESLETVMDITIKCLCEEPTGRPSMEDVVWNLQYALQVQKSSIGGGCSQDDFVDGSSLYYGENHPSKGEPLFTRGRRKSMGNAGNMSYQEMGKPSSANSEFFR